MSISVTASYDGYNHAIDNLIAKAAGCEDSGSGCCLTTGEREVFFDWEDWEKANECANKIKRAKIAGVRVKVDDWS